MQAKLSDIIGIINKLAPPVLAEDWDNVGLQVGDPSASIGRIMVALDPIDIAVDAAIHNSCQLLITHHPLIFKPLKRVSTSDETGRLVHKAISNQLAIASIHTNYDIVNNGINDMLADALDIQNCTPLKITHRDELVKLVVFVPASHRDILLEKLLPFCWQTGNYSDCSFSTSGTGTFRPLEGASPFLGTVGNRETVLESKIELLIPNSEIRTALKQMHKFHPYEEPAFDLIQLRNQGQTSGIGRIGNLDKPVPLRDFAKNIKSVLNSPALRVVGDNAKQVSKIAVCGGSGAFLLRDAAREGADLLVTGDIKYHEAREAESLGVALIDAGHFPTEFLMINGLYRQLENEFEKRNFDVELTKCTSEYDPFRLI